MKKHLLAVMVTVIAAGSVSLLAVRSEASASGSGDPRIAVLQKQVKALQVQLKSLQKAQKMDRALLDANFAGDTCLGAITADLIQGTWVAVDQVTQKTTFGAQLQVNDYGNCQALGQSGIQRAASLATPPTINTLLPLMEWLHE